MLQLGVLISGRGSNLQAILDAIAAGELDARVRLVISNKRKAAGLQRADIAHVRLGTTLWQDSAQGLFVPAHARGIGYVPQEGDLFPHLSVRGNLDYAYRRVPEAERTLALIGRAGALYPFFRSSALLKHLDGRTEHVPVVLLYPGERRSKTSLSFMGELEPDSDYRPRIYP